MRKLFFRGPVLTCSGYGVHARQVLHNLIKLGQFEISVEPIIWGNTPFLNDDIELSSQIEEMSKRFEEEKQAGFKDYDVSVQVTIPNEFQKYAKFNVGVTAGIEVDRASPEWIIKCNEMDAVIVPSRHSAESICNVGYRSSETSQELRFEKTMAVIPEGFDPSVFNTLPLEKEEFQFDTKFNFLFVGLGLDRPMFEDRKNISGLIKYFCEKFAGDRDVGLVLKVSIVGNSEMDRLETINRINEIKASTNCGQYPKIHLVHGRLSDASMAALYKCSSIKAMVSITHGEGYGLPLLEAAACGLPVIATNWSGHLDFLTIENKKKFIPIEFTAREIPNSMVWKGVMEQGSKWAEANGEDLKHKLKKFQLSSDVPRKWAQELAEHLSKNLSPEKIFQGYNDLFSKIVPNVSNDMDPRGKAQALREALQISPGQKTLLFTMPMSAGDVFISTAVIDSLKRKFPDHKFFYGTQEKYASILKDNQDIDRVVNFDNWMMNVPFCETVFTEVYTPNLDIQMNSSNWVHGGNGRKLGEEMANRCLVEFGIPRIKLDPYLDLPPKYIVIHPGSGKGQWEARNYNNWKEVLLNLKNNLGPLGYQFVLVGSSDDISLEGCVDLRGKTSYNQLAYVIQKASSLIGIDSVSMHMAAALGTPSVSLFGSSYSHSTGPIGSGIHFALEAQNRLGCEKACYKYQCHVDAENPCINEITPQSVVAYTIETLPERETFDKSPIQYVEYNPKIAGYTHVLNADSAGYPYLESVKSMLGFCDEVVVVDGGSTDDTLLRLNELAETDHRLKVMVHKWDWNEPGMDGLQKAYARAMCDVGTDDFLWQQDADEVVHEEDYAKIKKLVKKFPRDCSLLHLPVIELWGDGNTVRTDRHSWKWRLSRNDFRITHGINKAARILDPKTGRTYAQKGMSDGCEYVDVMTHEYIPHRGFYDKRLELLRLSNPKQYGIVMNKLYNEMPSVYHYSWASLPRKILNFKNFWNKCWSNLYMDAEPQDRFPSVDPTRLESVSLMARELKLRGGEHTKAETFRLERTNPTTMTQWLQRAARETDDRSDHDNEKQAGTAPEVSSVS